MEVYSLKDKDKAFDCERFDCIRQMEKDKKNNKI